MPRHAALLLMGLLAGLAVLLAAPAPIHAAPRPAPIPQATPLDRAAYVALLHTALDAANAVPAAADAPDRAALLARARAVLPASVVVRDAGGVLAEVDFGPVRAALAKEPPDLAGARRYLTALIGLLDPGSLPSPTATPTPLQTPSAAQAALALTPVYSPPTGAGGPPIAAGEAGSRLERVLADPRFQTDEGGGIQQALARALEPLVGTLLAMPTIQRNLLIAAVAGLLVAFMLYAGYREAPWSRQRYRATVAGGGLATFVLVFLLLTYGAAALGLLLAIPFLAPVLGGLGVLVAVGVAVFGWLGLRRARAPQHTRVASPFAAEAGWTADQARAAAEAAAGAQDYRKAIRYRYLATLLALDEAGRVRFDPALTNHEYLQRAPAPLRDPLQPLVGIFERLWYGGFPATAEDYHAYQVLAARAESVPAEVAS
jgi:hypothetical protein